MVVTKFQSYVEGEIPGSQYSANLRELIEKERACTNQLSTVLLDASTTNYLIEDSECVVFDYFQPSVIKKKLEEFVRNIISAGVYLIVVLRGNWSKDINMWYLKNKDDIDAFKKSGSSFNFFEIEGEFENSNSPYTGKSMIKCKFPFSSIRTSNYKVFRSIGYVHEKVAKLAIELNCLAVIGQDSNYLIYEGIRNYISIKSLNLKTLDCSVYNKNKIIEHLGLKPHHMPLFATLCGNDIVNVKHLYPFHNKITQKENKFVEIATKVKYLKGSSYDYLKDVVEEVNSFKVKEDLLKESLDMYSNFKSTLSKSKWLVFANKLKKTLKWENMLYKIFILKEYRSEKFLFLPPLFQFCRFLRPLRRKIYGILFFEDDNKTVAEYGLDCKMNGKFLVPIYVDSFEPECEHPGLMQLFDDKTPNVECMRLNLFYSSISKTLTHSTIRNLPPGLIFPALALYYLANECEPDFLKKIFTHQFEMEAFLIVAVLTHANANCAELRKAQKLKRPHLRPNALAVFYLEVCFTLKLLNEACGLPFSSEESSSIYNFFDELLFHSVYERMKDGAKWEEFFGGEILLEVLFSTIMEIVSS